MVDFGMYFGATMKKIAIGIAAITALIGTSAVALAQSTESQSTNDILRRLQAIEASNAALSKRVTELSEENAKLRDRVSDLKGSNHAAAAQQGSTTSASASRHTDAKVVLYDKASSPMVVKAPPAAPPPQDWSGIYVGLEGGYGWGNQSTDAIDPGDQAVFFTSVPAGGTIPQPIPPIFFSDVAMPSVKQNGWLFGGFFGAQKQWGNWVLGIEGDIDGANIKGSGTSNASFTSDTVITFTAPGGGTFIRACGLNPCVVLNHNVSLDSKIDALASVRGKVGWSFAPDWLVYGTGGAAFARVENTVTSTEVTSQSNIPPLAPFLCGPISFCSLSLPNNVSNESGTTTMFGWALGGGVDWKHQLDAGSAVVFGVEYLHYGFPEQTITLSDNAGGTFAFRAKQDVDAIKGRISYLFSIH
jgi:outer membrane immunogenic protein